MSRVDELPADQRAALLLLLRQHKTYAEVAGLLAIPERSVHDRAHAALAIIAPQQARGLGAEQRQEIGDYLLGQQAGVGERLRTRTLLTSSQAANSWAVAVTAELAGLGEDALGEVPPLAGDAGAAAAQEPYPISQATGAAAGSSGGSPSAPSSRRGGAIVLAVLAVVAIVAVILIVSGGSSNKKGGTGTSSKSASSKSTGPKQEGRIPLHAPPGSGSKGTVEILAEGSKHAFYIQAEHLPATKGFFYAIWLYNSLNRALPLSKSPPVGSNHRLAGAALLPSNWTSYREILLTRETSTRPKHPGHVVLRGKLNAAG